jgi:hypothetical protein
VDQVVYYHPLFWKHIDRLLKTHESAINPGALESFYSKTGSYVPNPNYYYSAYNSLHWIGKLLVNHSPVNRLDFLNKINVQYDAIPPDFNEFHKDFETVCLERATSLWEKYNDITVFWSGGLDSTCLALALMETKPVDSKFKMVGTQDSVDEYETFYNNFKSYITIVDNLFDPYYLTTHDTTVITGEAGDQIFCGAIADEFENKDKAWHSVIDQTLVGRLRNPKLKIQPEWNDREREFVLRSLHRIVASCPIHIERYADFLWWLTFTTKMNYVTHKFPTLIADHNLNMSKQTRLDTFIPFYLSDDFQRWSIKNQDVKLPGGPETYKQPIKDFIIRFFGDREFIQNKGKELSTIKTVKSDWHTTWIKSEDVNYARLADGTYYSRFNDLSTQQIENIILGASSV